jgi:hypothetical protein
VRLLDSTPKLTPSTAELQADGAQVRVAGLIPEDQHVRISHVHREAFHHRTLDVGSRGHSMTAHLKINAFADFAFDEQRKLVLEKQNELHEQDQTLTAENSVYQRFEALNLDRLIARARRGDNFRGNTRGKGVMRPGPFPVVRPHPTLPASGNISPHLAE